MRMINVIWGLPFQGIPVNLQIEHAVDILSRTPRILDEMLRNLPAELTSSNEGPNSWSAYDVMGHFIHGELTDWIPRMKIILSEGGNKNFEPFDRFAQFENSRGKTLHQLLDEFASLRARNVAILRSTVVHESQLDRTGVHPAFGDVTLRQLISTWVVHDLNHIAQISRVMAKQYKSEVGPWVEYLGILASR